MSNKIARTLGFALGAVALLATAQTAGAAQQPAAAARPDPQETVNGAGRIMTIVEDKRPFDAKDFNGVWRGVLYGYGRVAPEFTPEGRARFDANKPSYGIPADHPDAKTRTEVTEGRRRAVPPAVGNDPVGRCNPLGLSRLILYQPSPMEFIQTKDRLVQRFEWTWDHREVWTDGRKLPNVDDYLPRWNGYSIGHWEGDTFVVETVGLDEREWIDHYGYPISSHAKLTERWKRVNYSTMEVLMTIDDPETYKTPFKSDPARFRRVEGEVAPNVWNGLVEDKCVPFDNDPFYATAVKNAAGQ